MEHIVSVSKKLFLVINFVCRIFGVCLCVKGYRDIDDETCVIEIAGSGNLNDKYVYYDVPREKAGKVIGVQGNEKRIAIKVGKFLNKFNILESDLQHVNQALSSCLKGFGSEYRIRILSPSSIPAVYDTCHNVAGLHSCMTGNPEFLEIWEHNSNGIIVVYDDNEDIVARALLHAVIDVDTGNPVLIADRIYTASGHHIEWYVMWYLLSNNIVDYVNRYQSYDKKLVFVDSEFNVVCKTFRLYIDDIYAYEYLPYADTLTYIHQDDTDDCYYLSNDYSNSLSALERTDGADTAKMFAVPSGVCCSCGDTLPHDDLMLDPVNGYDYYCRNCFHDAFIYCEHGDHYVYSPETDLYSFYDAYQTICIDCIDDDYELDVCSECAGVYENTDGYTGTLCPSCRPMEDDEDE